MLIAFIVIFLFVLTIICGNIINNYKTDKVVEYKNIEINDIKTQTIELQNNIDRITKENNDLKTQIDKYKKTTSRGNETRKNVSTKVFEKTNYSAEQFDIMLSNTKLKNCGIYYYNMEQQYNVNGVFAISIMCLESGNGYKTANTHNYYGMRASKGGWKSFASPEDNIMYFGKYITSKMYYGKSINEIAKIYCPPTWNHWVSNVQKIMNQKISMVK